MDLENMPGSLGGRGRRSRVWPADACGLVWPLCGRESIFLFSHTNEFCGKSKVALEAGVAWARLKRGRRVCERGQMRKRLPACCGACKRVRRRVTAPALAHPKSQIPRSLTGSGKTYLILQRPSAGLLLRLVGHWPSPLESHRGESPPTKSAALGPYGVLGMPRGGGRLVLPSPKDGLCGRLADGKSYHLSSGR